MNTKPAKVNPAMNRTYLSILFGIFLAAPEVPAAELKLFPPEVTLTGPHAQQRVIALKRYGGHIVGDLTRQVKFSVANPTVARIDDQGVLHATGDGETTVTAENGGIRSSITVRVQGVKAPFTWSFRNHVIPTLTRLGCNSGACHGALAGKGGLKLSLRGYSPADDYFVLTRQAGGRRVNELEPAHSLMLLKPTMAVPHGGGQRLDVGSPEYQLLADWIASGTPGPRADDVRIQRLEVLPPEAVLKPKDALPVLVRAWYTDGHSEDVTRRARLSSTEDLVATVNESGHVRVTGHGEAAISVIYSNLVATARILSPFPNRPDSQTFAQSPRHNFIDTLVLKKLEALRIPPSPGCTDQEFIRRAFLDACGTLPTPEEVQHFLADAGPDKRARLIDRLLDRPEFVDYWSYRWSDLLLISSRKLSQPAVWAFYQQVRQSVADNKPWDRFARDILTATGSNLQNGGVNYFVLHKDVSELTETTAVTFMGMSVTCCRCHNHPLEKWTQDQYWSMANLFSRVAVKNGERPGETVIHAQPFGDVLHPRRGVAMPPTPLDGKPLATDSAADRRKYFADWLTDSDNPYFARALVNRVWRNYLGRGLVEAEDDLRQTNPPSNPELLDALARDFVTHKYDVKHLMRTVLNSAAYQRSSKPLPGNAADDRFYSRYLIRRLPAEVVLDAYAQVTGVPTEFNQLLVGASGGTSGTNAYPLGTRALQLPDTQVISRFLDAFGRPERLQTCSCERQEDSSVGQALHLNNGKTLNDKLRSPKGQIQRWLDQKVSDAEAVRRIFLAALCREPTGEERRRLLGLMAEAGRDPQSTRREVLEDLFWGVLTGREFLFNH
jgi:hypothetical protein